MEQIKVDVAIIGSGTAGLNAMGRVKRAGKDFVLINGGEPGTTCARVGCMPSKVLIQIAEDFHRRGVYDRMGIEKHESMHLNAQDSMEHVRDMRDTFVDRVLSNSTDHLGPDVFIEQYAKFIEPDILQLDNGDQVQADSIVIATGSSPIVPDAWKAFGDRVVTTDQIFELEDLPDSMAIVGLGVIGLEIGQSLCRMGVDVVGIDMAENIGGVTDPEVNKEAVTLIGKEFPLWLGHAVELAEEPDGRIRVTAGENSITVDKVLASLGRRPNIGNLDLDKLGIKVNEKGIPKYNPNTMQIGELPIFLAGDVNGERPILHEAGDEGKIAGYNAAHHAITAFKRKTPLAIVFSDPNIISVGQRYADLDPDTSVIGEMKIAPVGRALIMAKNRGVIRVYANKTSGKLLGAEMITPRGENLGHLLAWSIQMGLTVGQLLQMPFYHPVIEEALQAALNNLYHKVETKNSTPVTELALLDH